MADMYLPVVAGFIYPCAIPPVEEGEYFLIDSAEHMGYVDLFNLDHQLMTTKGEVEDYTPELWETIEAALAQHPANIAFEKRALERQKEADAALAPLAERIKAARAKRGDHDHKKDRDSKD